MNNVSVEKSSGLSLAGVLTVVFVTLKLVGLISWSWLWVLAPVWLPFALGFTILGTVLLLALLIKLLK